MSILSSFCASPQIPVSALVSFVEALEVGYSKHRNPYHNLIHAADVTQTVHYLLLKTGMVVSPELHLQKLRPYEFNQQSCLQGFIYVYVCLGKIIMFIESLLLFIIIIISTELSCWSMFYYAWHCTWGIYWGWGPHNGPFSLHDAAHVPINRKLISLNVSKHAPVTPTAGSLTSLWCVDITLVFWQIICPLAFTPLMISFCYSGSLVI